MRLSTPFIAFSLCVFAGYAEVRPQTKNSPSGFDLVDKSGNIRKPADGVTVMAIHHIEK